MVAEVRAKVGKDGGVVVAPVIDSVRVRAYLERFGGSRSDLVGVRDCANRALSPIISQQIRIQVSTIDVVRSSNRRSSNLEVSSEIRARRTPVVADLC
ncbi:hypothetical protein TIFTF001_017264 [Ficus carica]|uniref:Uncharacterized protein n=1 Tax=Ficus carica TaxID=3494 RepID=A0AA88AQF7_FICCA|nr:hypothetical protein TIFTF001_017264 [Ficus carica]